MTERPAPAAVHEKGILHRDLKPENLFVEQIAFLGQDEKGTNGSRVAIAGREIVSSLVLLEGVTGLGPSK